MAQEEEIKNAVIKSAILTLDSPVGIGIDVNLSYGNNTEQNFGGFCLYNKEYKGEQPQHNFLGYYITRLLEIADVYSFEKLKGRPVRVRGTYLKVSAIGHFLNDDWFDPSKEFDAMRNEK